MVFITPVAVNISSVQSLYINQLEENVLRLDKVPMEPCWIWGELGLLVRVDLKFRRAIQADNGVNFTRKQKENPRPISKWNQHI